ncbi:MAG TPA: TPM domain-containing protein [Verrucomicrobiae bacterium]|nr:TPM domain-containing protein [Verrucomicrobiae bacterium]
MRSVTHSPGAFAIALFAVFLGLTAIRGQALPPTPKDFFNDYAGVVHPAVRQELNDRLRTFCKQTSQQVVVAIFPAMDSALSLDDYTLKLANSWAVGQRGTNNGVVLFVFIKDRKMRIQVGSGLTGILTDELCKRILDQDLKPAFRRGDFDGGLAVGVGSILSILTKPLAGPAQGQDRFYELGGAAKKSFEEGKSEVARKDAEELLTLAPKYKGDWNYGNAVQDGNIVLGRIALKEGRLDEARTRLIAAGRSPGSPQMDTFGPNMSLAKDLLQKGELQVVVQYFGLCSNFWKMDNGKLNQWSQEVKSGEIPDFGANLVY